MKCRTTYTAYQVSNCTSPVADDEPAEEKRILLIGAKREKTTLTEEGIRAVVINWSLVVVCTIPKVGIAARTVDIHIRATAVVHAVRRIIVINAVLYSS